MPDFLEEPREVTFDWHITQVKRWLEFDGGRILDSVVVYAAFELRLAIERYLFELLLLMKDQHITQDEERRCQSVKGVEKMMIEVDKDYRKTINFTRLLSSTAQNMPEITIVDTAYLIRKWRELSDYCHKHLRPEQSFNSPNRAFQRKGYKLITKVFGRFSEWIRESNCGIIRRDSLKEEVRDLYDMYIRDEITDEQVQVRVRLMEPILTQRFVRARSLRLEI